MEKFALLVQAISKLYSDDPSGPGITLAWLDDQGATVTYHCLLTPIQELT